MNANNRRLLLGLAAVMGLGLLGLGANPAAAAPPKHAPAWGYRNNPSHRDSNYRDRDHRYDRNRTHVYYGNDIDGDRIPNDRDWDIDGDGIANGRDNNPFGSGFDYSRGSRSGRDADRDGVRNSRDRDIDGDGRRNSRDRDIDGDGRSNSRDRHDRNPTRR